MKVLSIYAGNDLKSTEAEIFALRELFPEDTVYHRIEGGNHSGFGYYGDQKGDGPRDIEKLEQQNIIVRLCADFLLRL